MERLKLRDGGTRRPLKSNFRSAFEYGRQTRLRGVHAFARDDPPAEGLNPSKRPQEIERKVERPVEALAAPCRILGVGTGTRRQIHVQ